MSPRLGRILDGKPCVVHKRFARNGGGRGIFFNAHWIDERFTHCSKSNGRKFAAVITMKLNFETAFRSRLCIPLARLPRSRKITTCWRLTLADYGRGKLRPSDRHPPIIIIITTFISVDIVRKGKHYNPSVNWI